MPRPPFANKSSPLPKPTAGHDLLNLNLPEVPIGQEPLPSEGFTYEARLNHARFLIQSFGHQLFKIRDQHMQVAPFVWID